MNPERSQKHSVDTLFSFLLFGLFVLFLLVLLLFSAQLYQRSVGSLDENQNLHTAATYLTTKFRQHDNAGSRYVTRFGDLDALCFEDVIDDTACTTYIYLLDNELKELFTLSGTTLSPDAGTTIAAFPISQAKKNCIAYDLPPAREPGQRGRPRQKGDKVQVAALFQTHRDAFIPAKVELYGKIHALRYYCINLLWGKGLYQELRFVLVQMSDGRESIFACTKLDLDPLTIIRFYSYRFKIENCFRELKQVFAGLKYRFWSKFMPKLNHYSKTTDPTPLSFVTDLREREGILKTIRSNEIYILKPVK